jgi:O-antigen/teichoic acid export membrane protein
VNLPQRVAFNTSVQVGGQLVGLAIGLVTLRATTGYLSLETFGQLSIVLAVSALLVTMSDLGVTTTLARELAKTPERADVLGAQLLRFRIASAAAVTALGYAALPLLPYDRETKIALSISLASVFLASMATFPRAFFQAHLRLHLQAAIDLLTRTLGLFVILAVIVLGLGLYAIVGLLVASSATAMLLAFVLSRRFWRMNLRSDWTLARPLIRDALGIGVVSMIGLLHLKADAILLSFLKPPEDVGIYTVAFRFVEQAFFLPGLFVAAVFPILARYAHQRDERLAFVVDRTFRVLVLGAISVSIALYVLAPFIVRVIATSEYDAAVSPARILSLALVFVFAGPVFYNLLFAVNRQRELILIGVGAVVLNVSLNLLLIPRYSYNGAAVATVISEFAGFVGTFLVAKRLTSIGIDWSFVLKAVLATCVAASTAAAVWNVSLWAALLLSEMMLVAAALLLGAVNRAELRSLVRRSTS